jgi:hypothetical protein
MAKRVSKRKKGKLTRALESSMRTVHYIPESEPQREATKKCMIWLEKPKGARTRIVLVKIG